MSALCFILNFMHDWGPTPVHSTLAAAACTSLRSKRCCRRRRCRCCWARFRWLVSRGWEESLASRCGLTTRLRASHATCTPYSLYVYVSWRLVAWDSLYSLAICHMKAGSACAAQHKQVMSELGISTVGELAAVPLPRLEAAFGDKDAQWLAAVAHGITGRLAGGGRTRAGSVLSHMCS